MEMTPTDEIQYLKHVIELMQEQLDSRNNMITSLLQMQHPVITSTDELKSIVKSAMSEWADSINVGQNTEQLIDPIEHKISYHQCYEALMKLPIPKTPNDAVPAAYIRLKLKSEFKDFLILNEIIDAAITTAVKRHILIRIEISNELKQTGKYSGHAKYLYYMK